MYILIDMQIAPINQKSLKGLDFKSIYGIGNWKNIQFQTRSKNKIFLDFHTTQIDYFSLKIGVPANKTLCVNLTNLDIIFYMKV